MRKRTKNKVAIECLETASEMSLAVYGLPLVVTTSGGKDSSVCIALAERAGIPFEVLHNHTTADAPETVYFIREEFHRWWMEDGVLPGQLNFDDLAGLIEEDEE